MASAVLRVPRRQSRWTVPLLLFLAVLLAAGLAFNVANLDTGGEAIPAPPNTGGTSTSNQGLIDPGSISQIAGIALVVVVVLLAVFFLPQRRAKLVGRRKPMSLWDVLGTAMGLVLFLAVLLAWPKIAQALSAGRQAAPGKNETEAGAMIGLPTVAGIPAGVFLAISFGAALVALIFFLHLGSVMRRRPSPAPSLPRRTAAAEAVQTAIAQLELGGDVRAVILACFERFCELLGDRGFRDQSALTPRELEALAVRGLRVSEDSAEALTSLFEEARYSVHSLGEADRDRAVVSLQRIRVSLEA